MFVLLLAPTALAAPDLYVNGACPGPANVEVHFATPGGRVAFVRGAGPGEFAIPSGVCAGAYVPLSSPTLVTFATADAAGTVALSPTLGAPACGAWLTAIDLSTCTASAAIPVTPHAPFSWTFGDASPQSIFVEAVEHGWVAVYNTPTGATIARLGLDGSVQSVTNHLLAWVSAVLPLPNPDEVALVGLEVATGDRLVARYDANDTLTAAHTLSTTLYPWLTFSGFMAGASAPDGSVLSVSDRYALFAADGSVEWSNLPPPGVIGRTASRGLGSWLVAGVTDSTTGDLYLARIADDGATLTEDAYDTGFNETAIRAFEIPGGSVIAMSRTDDPAGSCLLTHLSASGSPYWARQVSLAGYDPPSTYCLDMEVKRDGVVVVGMALGATADGFVFFMDFEGRVHWTRHFADHVVQAVSANDHGMAMIALDGANAAVFSTDANGDSPCLGTETTAIATPIDLTWIPRLIGGTVSWPTSTPTTVPATVGYSVAIGDECPFP